MNLSNKYYNGINEIEIFNNICGPHREHAAYWLGKNKNPSKLRTAIIKWIRY